jgi:predicted phage-related endonuclease
MLVFHDIEQGTDEWLSLRMGRFTASTFNDLTASKSTLTYQKAINKVVFERLTGESPESFKSEYMERGNELEPLARERYELESFNDVKNGGFFSLGEYIGASPDGLVNDDGINEFKCPSFNTMINYLLKKELPSEYKYQVQGQLFVTGRKWCDFMAYHPKLKPLIIRVERDDIIIKEIQSLLVEAIKLVETRINLIK